MQNDVRPSAQDPAMRVVFSHPAETEPMAPTAVQQQPKAARFSADTDTRRTR
jgi:hypothetical protein